MGLQRDNGKPTEVESGFLEILTFRVKGLPLE